MKNYFSAVVTLVVPQEVTLFVIRILALHVNLIRVGSLIYAHKLEKMTRYKRPVAQREQEDFFPGSPSWLVKMSLCASPTRLGIARSLSWLAKGVHHYPALQQIEMSLDKPNLQIFIPLTNFLKDKTRQSLSRQFSSKFVISFRYVLFSSVAYRIHGAIGKYNEAF